jgi:hypothetical protein
MRAKLLFMKSAQNHRRVGPRYSLLTLLIVMLLAGALGPLGWVKWKAWKQEQEGRAIERQRQEYEALVKTLNDSNGGTRLRREPQERIRRVRAGEETTKSNADDASSFCPNPSSASP